MGKSDKFHLPQKHKLVPNQSNALSTTESSKHGKTANLVYIIYIKGYYWNLIDDETSEEISLEEYFELVNYGIIREWINKGNEWMFKLLYGNFRHLELFYELCDE